MRVLILGGDGYLGWPTAMDLAARGHRVLALDNYLRRDIAAQTDSEALVATPLLPERAALFRELTGHEVEVEVGDCRDMDCLDRVFARFAPEAVVHYAEQPSAPYSMRGYAEARLTLDNNLAATFNTVWAMLRHAPQAHLVKLGTMGEYGTPNIAIEEGWLTVQHKGREHTFLYPRQAGSLYHTTKVLDTDLLWFYVRLYGLEVTDLMQGPVYGLSTDQADLDGRLMPNFHYDDIFGTVLNRFLVQAAAGLPLTVYGKGGQTRGYLNLKDTLQCVRLALESPPGQGRLRILNQFTETFSVSQLAQKVVEAARGLGLGVSVAHIPNPRKELEEHFYEPASSGFKDLGLKPHLLSPEVLADMLETVLRHRANIVPRRVQPRVSWS